MKKIVYSTQGFVKIGKVAVNSGEDIEITVNNSVIANSMYKFLIVFESKGNLDLSVWRWFLNFIKFHRYMTIHSYALTAGYIHKLNFSNGQLKVSYHKT